MELLALIDRLQETLRHARPVPLTTQVRVDRRELDDLIEQIRAAVPAAGAGAPSATAVDQEAVRAAVAAAIRESIPDIARATAAAARGEPPPPSGPGSPF